MTLEELQITEEMFRRNKGLREELHKALSVHAFALASVVLSRKSDKRSLPIATSPEVGNNAFQQGVGATAFLDGLMRLTQPLPEDLTARPLGDETIEIMGERMAADKGLLEEKRRIEATQAEMARKRAQAEKRKKGQS